VLCDLLDAAGGEGLLALAERAAAYLFPLLGGDAVEGFDHVRVELDARVFVEFGERLFVAAPRAVDAV
jgi:hypothetical protein